MSQDEFRDLPTPQPLDRRPSGPGERSSSFFDRLLEHRKLLAVLVGIGFLLAIASGLLLWQGDGGGGAEPTLEIPPSLDELAQQ
ncbi:MAG: hypothetical protein EHM56_06935 [Chloroflexi bacterium]|nr:MAG: hypothetical protein EHM56_06935 [Chloroflexota bacterium]